MYLGLEKRGNMSVFDVLREKLDQTYGDIVTEYYVRAAEFKSKMLEIIDRTEQEFIPKTNADMIRSMTDEQLAEFIANDCLELSDMICGSCTQETTENCGSGCCVEHIVSWLKKEVKE